MKKLFIASLFVMGSLIASAQNVSIGPSIGVGHSWITSFDEVQVKPGFNAGISLVYSPAEHWGLGGDIRASFLEGVKTSVRILGTDYDYKLNATYLRVPLKVIYFAGNHGDKIRPKLYAGPSFGFLLGGKTNAPAVGTEVKAKDTFEAFDFGLTAGAGFNYRIKEYTWLNIDLAYTNGLLDALKTTGFNSNRNLSLNVGVTFPLGTAKP